MEKENVLEIYEVIKEDCKSVSSLYAVLGVDLLEKMNSAFMLCDFLLEHIDESCHKTFLDCIYNGGEWEEIEDKIKVAEGQVKTVERIIRSLKKNDD